MVRRIFSSMAGVIALALISGSVAAAQVSAPRVRLVRLPTISSGNLNSSFSLSEAAYILAVAVDRDGRISVLSPELPNDVIRFAASRSISLPEFFTGFSTAGNSYYGGYAERLYRASYSRADGDMSPRGTVMVIASRTPLNFASISRGVFWNEDALAELVRYRTPSGAVNALGRAVTAKGQSFGHDVLGFGYSGYSSFGNYGECVSAFSMSYYGYSNYPGPGYGYIPGYFANGVVILAATASTPGLKLVNFGTDECGRPHVATIEYYLPAPPEKKPDTVVTQPAQFRAAPGTYTGDAAREVIEMLQRGHTSEGYSIVSSPRVTSTGETGVIAGRPISREPATRAEESFERIRGYSQPIEHQVAPQPASAEPTPRAPVMQSEPRVERSQPVDMTPSAPPPV